MSDSRMMVMVASLERHLQAERKTLSEAIIGQNAVPVGLAYPSIPANYIYKLNLHCLNDADYVVLLIGDEYGALTDRGVGYLHATYAAAQAARKPILSLIFNGTITRKTDSFDRKRLQGLIEQLKTGMVYYWHDEDSLRDSAEIGLEYIFERYPAVGWVKADVQQSAPDLNRDDQNLIQKLKTQVQQLKNKVQSDPKDSASDDIDFSKDQHDWKVRYHCNAFREGKLKQLEGELSFPLREVFDWLSPTMMSPVTESRLRVVISGRIQSAVLANARTYWAGSHAVSDIKIQQASFDDLKLRLKALSVIAFDQQGRWYLTPAGEQAALQVIQ